MDIIIYVLLLLLWQYVLAMREIEKAEKQRTNTERTPIPKKINFINVE